MLRLDLKTGLLNLIRDLHDVAVEASELWKDAALKGLSNADEVRRKAREVGSEAVQDAFQLIEITAKSAAKLLKTMTIDAVRGAIETSEEINAILKSKERKPPAQEA